MLRFGIGGLLLVALLALRPALADEPLDCVGQPDPTGIGFTTICAGQESFEAGQLQNWSCEELWDLRNNILYTLGYCFKTERTKAAFDNVGCSSETLAQANPNEHQRHNIGLIESLEKQKSCPAN